MKKLVFLSVVALTATMTLNTISAVAVDGGQADSIGDVTFKKDTGTVDPVDPEDPGVDPVDPTDPTDPTDPVTPGTPGPLSIDYVSNFKFDEQVISGNDEVYFAKLRPITLTDGTQKEVANYLQVTDNRGTNVGWHLTATQNEQFKHTTSGTELDGAEIELLNPEVDSSINNGSNLPDVSGTMVFVPGQATDILDAKVDHGMGTWVESFGTNAAGAPKQTGAESVKLSVPGSSKKEEAQFRTSK